MSGAPATRAILVLSYIDGVLPLYGAQSHFLLRGREVWSGGLVTGNSAAHEE